MPKYKDFFLIKQLKISDRYKKGCSVRLKLMQDKEIIAYMQNIMYCTFVKCIPYTNEIDVVFKDKNTKNYQLHNLHEKVRQNENMALNLRIHKDVYNTNFIDLCYYSHFLDEYLSIDECKDIVSESFYELCGSKQEITEYYFLVKWKITVRHRTFDYLERKYRTSLEDFVKEKSMVSEGVAFEVENPLNAISNERHKRMVELWAQNVPTREISEITSEKESTIRCNVSRVLSYLKKYYKKDIEIYRNGKR